MIKLELTPEEANGVLQLIDIAIKAGGVAAAKVGVPIFDKILGAANEAGLITPPAAASEEK
jgi:hypothetical protein